MTHADIDEKLHPYILPYTHPVATTLIRNQHEVAHLGREGILGIVQRRFWIIKARRIVKRVSCNCLVCQNTFVCTDQQRMADFRPERLH